MADPGVLIKQMENRIAKLENLLSRRVARKDGSFTVPLNNNINDKVAAVVHSDIQCKSLSASYAGGTGNISGAGDLSMTGYVKGSSYKSSDGTNGATADVTISGTTLSFKNGIFVGTI